MVNQQIRFSEEDLNLFSAASGDRNPLHLSREYSSQTSFGQRVVFGVLGSIACLGRIQEIKGLRITKLTAEFLRPMFLDVNYRVQAEERDGEWVAYLYDGSVMVLSLSVRALAAPLDTTAATSSTPLFERDEAATSSDEGFFPGREVSGRYSCDGAALSMLAQRWGVSAHVTVLAAMCWSSYFVGMELPGRSALFFKLVLEFDSLPGGSLEMNWRASIRSFDIRTRQLRMDFSISAGESRIASGECRAFSRPPMPVEELMAGAPVSNALAGRVALVIGASRGLGAATSRALESRGALVYSLSRSTPDVTGGRFESGDATDLDALQRLRHRIASEQGRLDILVCNACPAILPLRLEPNALARMEEYVHRAFMLTAAPLSVFLDLLNQSGGCAVIVSSGAVERPVREWPHYIAAKNAVEGLARVAPMQYRQISSVIVRPEKLLTEMTNTPIGRLGAIPPKQFAVRIAERLGQPLTQGTCEVFC